MITTFLHRTAAAIAIIITATLAGALAGSAAITAAAPDPVAAYTQRLTSGAGASMGINPAAPLAGRTPWQHVQAYCHRTRVCMHPSRQLRRQLGIGHARAWERPENDAAGWYSTFVWVRGPGGTVRTYVS